MSQTSTNAGGGTQTVTKTPQETDGAEVALAAKAAIVVQAVAETVQSLNIHLMEK